MPAETREQQCGYRERDERLKRPDRNRGSQQAAGERDQQAFGHQLPNHSARLAPSEARTAIS